MCDGAVRSGKTVCIGLSVFFWAMAKFNGEQFALCGRTAGSVRRNLLHSVQPELKTLGFRISEKVSMNQITVRFNGRCNTFYLFGGKDESSAALIQGITLAGVLLDEVVLMPRSFVEQALARCSVAGAKAWFTCNPEGPEHWFYKEWVLGAEGHRALRVPFSMTDNPSLSREVLQRYQRSFRGAFYRRFVLGEWAVAEGRVYDFFDESMVKPVPQGTMEEWRVSCDYGTVNPTSMGLWGRQGKTWYRVREFYYDARKEGRQKTDREYERDLRRLVGEHRISRIVADPSAASFLTVLEEAGWPVERADNEVIRGIRVTAEMLTQGRLVICTPCRDAIREFSLYCWDSKAGEDKVIKRFDHAMDDIRYFAASLEQRSGYIGGYSVARGGGW